MEPLLIIVAIAAVLSAGMIQVITGFGFALVSIPLLFYVFPGYKAILISMLLSVFTLTLQSRKNWRQARWDLIWRLTAIGLVGLVVGVMVSGKLNADMLKSIVGVVVFIYVIIQWVQTEKERRSGLKEQAATTEVEVSEKIERKRKYPKGFYTAGLFSGLLTGGVGMPGPPVVAVLVQFLQRETFRATLVNYFLVNYLFALFLALFVFQREHQLDVLLAAASLIIPTFIGYLIGHPVRKFIKDDQFKRIVFALLLIIALSFIWQFIFSLW